MDSGLGSVCKGVDYTILGGQVVVAIPLKILVSVGWFSIYLCCEDSINLRCY